ncbi:MAG: RNA methyltransferase [Phycisphaerae bacterium]|nr:RNA methyltransferase [Phycisphaerae bacterium]
MTHLEGRQSVLAALQARLRRFQVVLLRQGLHEEQVQDILDAAAANNTPIRWAAREELDALTHGATHGGVVAICSARPLTTVAQLFEIVDHATRPPLILLLEGVDDARNLGFTLRSAEAFGASAVLIKKHLWDFDEVEISRPASGAFERLPLVQIEDVAPLRELQKRGVRIFGAIANARRVVYDAPLAEACILVVGGEKRGISGAVRDLCDQLITIPTVAGASSLPLAHAAALLLGEAARQRRQVS